MKTFRLSRLGACLLLVGTVFSTLASPLTLIPVGSAWKYSADGTDWGTAWRGAAFDDSTWLSGAAQLGYGDGDEVTVVATPAERPATVYFRKSVLIPSGVVVASVRLLRDDGAVVYVNGVEVLRNNMPAGLVTHQTLALSAIGGAEETDAFVSAPISTSAFAPGTNIVAVEIHQNSLLSSDMSFALELIVDFVPPTALAVEAVVPETREVSPFTDQAVVPGVFRVTRTETNAPLMVGLRLTGTASNSIDYEFVESLAAMPAGTASLDVQITALDDLLVEGTETVVLHAYAASCLACANGTVTNGAPATIRILDNDVGNTPPVVNIFQPTNGSTFPAPGYVFLQATAEDAEDDGLLKVEFFAGHTRIGEAEFYPTLCPQNCPYYALGWSNMPPGSYSVTARATDNGGLTTTSSPVQITFLGTNAPGQAPRVVEQPQSLTVNVGATATFSVTVTGSPPFTFRWQRNGTTVRVTTEPSLTLSNVQPAQAGAYRVLITNAYGLTISSNAMLTVINTNPPPPEQTFVHVVASDPNASEPGVLTVVDSGRFSIRRRGNMDSAIPVSFRLSGTASNGVDYSFVSNSVVLPAGATQAVVNINALPDTLPEGIETVVLTLEPPLCFAVYPPPPECYLVEGSGEAVVTISDGSSVSNRPPLVSITMPTNGTVMPRGSVHIVAVARDLDGYVNRVQFFGNDQLIGEQIINFVVAPPPGESMTFEMTWTNPPVGLVGLRARAFDDGGASAPSLPVFITIAGTNPPPATNEVVIRFEPPSLPRGSALISNWVESGFVFWTPNRLAHSDNGVSSTSPSNGTPFLQLGANHSPLVIRRADDQSFDLRGADLSEYSTVFQMPKHVTFTGFRADGSTVVREVTTDGVIDGSGPAMDFQAIEFGSDFAGLVRVEVTPPPYALDNVRVRSNSITPPSTNPAPQVVMVSPVNGSSFPAGTNIFLGANVFATSGVQRVDFYAGESWLGQASGPLPGPMGAWGLNWSPAPAGSHSLRAVALDLAGRRGTSPPVNITVVGALGPVVRVLVSDSNAMESAGSIVNTGRLTFMRSGPVSNALPVFINLSGTALNGIDYLALSNIVFFPPGASNVHLVVTPRDDEIAEPTEVAVVTILAPPTSPGAIPYIVGAPAQAAVFIHDNDTNVPPPGALIATGSNWKYRDTGHDLGTAWREPGYNDAEWPSGPAQLGFGDGDEATIVDGGPMTNRVITTYFRHTFDVANPGAVSNLVVRLMRDDGGVVYLNGVEVFRSNMPAGAINYFTLATMASDESVDFYSSPVDASLLVAGQNVVAVEIHQNALTSSDLSFDLELTASGSTPVERTVVTVVASDPEASEPDATAAINPGQFALRRTGNINSPIQVIFSLGGTAGNGSDYNLISNRVTIPAGATQALVTVNPRMDALVEGTESVLLTIQPPICAAVVPPPASCYLIGTPATATVLIEDSVNPSNRPPVATIVRPSDGSGFRAPANILLGANAADDGIVQRLEFEANGAFLGNASGPFTTPAGAWLLTWSNVPPGSYELRAVAVDAFGARGTSAPVSIFVTNAPVAEQVTLVATGSVWKYHDEGTDLGDAWRAAGYDDDDWSSGPAQLGYGDLDEATIVSAGPDPAQKNITTYFRRAFDVANPASFDTLHLRLLYDDGAVVYLNGVEILRANMLPGPVGFTTPASSVSMDNAIAETTVSAAPLVSGRNVLAVEIHQVNQISSDISFDLALTASGEELPPLPPIVELVAPADGAVFNGPTNIVLTARVSDPNGDETVRLLEFFAGTLRLGARTNFPGGGLTAPYSFTWLNAPVGAHALTAVATDQGGARATSAPVHITVQGHQEPSPDSELHLVAVYSGLYNGGSSPNHQRGDAHVVVDRPEREVTLYLSAYEPVLWHVEVRPGTTVDRVFLAGYYAQEITGLPEGIPVQRVNNYVGYTLDCAGFYLSAPEVRRLTGLEIASFHGSYTAVEPFVIDAISDDPRLRSDFPRTIPPNEVPVLNFQISFAARGSSSVSHRSYTLQGPASGPDVLPEMRVYADPAGRYFYGVESHEAWRIDTQLNSAMQMTLPAGLPEFSWAWSGTYDTTRNRFLVSSFGGTGYLYGYSPSNETWSVVRDWNQLDLNSIVYHAATDQLFALSMMFTECDRPRLYRLSADGEVLDDVLLPIVPFARYGVRAELVSVGEHLVLLVQSRFDTPESRIYLVDPETGAVRLTYRHVAGIDDDHDGVPNSRDRCPATPPGTVVGEDGCPVSVADSDGDGVADTVDACPGTAAGAVVNGNGCSIAQLVPCDGPWLSHSNYVQAVAAMAETFQKEGLITLRQRLEIVIQARRALCGFRPPRLAVPLQCEDEIRTNGCRLVLSGEGPGTCVIECSVDLIHWTPISTNVLSGATIPIVDPASRTAPRRFYRLRTEIVSPLLMKPK